MKTTYLVAALGAAFAAGLGAARYAPQAQAQQSPPALEAKIINLAEMTDEQIGPLVNNSDLRSRLLGATEHGTISVQSGNVFKHNHPNTHEIQYIIAGSGSFWLGDKEVQVKPGDLIIIPKGVNHAGSKATTGRFKAIAFKMPPQAPTDTVRVD